MFDVEYAFGDLEKSSSGYKRDSGLEWTKLNSSASTSLSRNASFFFSRFPADKRPKTLEISFRVKTIRANLTESEYSKIKTTTVKAPPVTPRPLATSEDINLSSSSKANQGEESFGSRSEVKSKQDLMDSKTSPLMIKTMKRFKKRTADEIANESSIKEEQTKDIDSPNGTPKKKRLMKKKDIESPTSAKTLSADMSGKPQSSIEADQQEKESKGVDLASGNVDVEALSVKKFKKKSGAPVKRVYSSNSDRDDEVGEMEDYEDDNSSDYGDEKKSKAKKKKSNKKGIAQEYKETDFERFDREQMEKFQAIICTGKVDHLSYNLKYGQRLQVNWNGLWYKARAVWYSYQDDGDLLLKVNFDGWPKSEDLYLNITKDPDEYIRGPDFSVHSITLGKSKKASFDINGIRPADHYGLRTAAQIDFVKKHGYYLSALPETARFVPKDDE